MKSGDISYRSLWGNYQRSCELKIGFAFRSLVLFESWIRHLIKNIYLSNQVENNM